MTLAFFNELPDQSQISLGTLDRGALSAMMVTGTGITSPVARTLFVAMNGNDATADGSLVRPFLNIDPAIDRAVALGASVSTPFSVLVFPGVYSGFGLGADVFVVGLDPLNCFLQSSVNARSTLLTGTHITGMANFRCATVSLDFTGMTSVLDVFLFHLSLGSAQNIAITGDGAGLIVYIDDILSQGATSSTLTLTNVAASNIGGASFRVGALSFVANTNNFSQTHRCLGLASIGSLTATSTQTSTNLVVALHNSVIPANPTSWTVSGTRTQVGTRGLVQVTGADANTTFSFGNIPNASGAVVLGQGAENTIETNPTAARTYTFEGPGAAGTRVRIVNINGANAITLAYGGGAAGPAGTVPANTTLELYGSSATQWRLGG